MKESKQEKYWRKRAVRAEEMLIIVSTDERWAARIGFYFEQVQKGQLQELPEDSLTAAVVRPSEEK